MSLTRVWAANTPTGTVWGSSGSTWLAYAVAPPRARTTSVAAMERVRRMVHLLVETASFDRKPAGGLVRCRATGAIAWHAADPSGGLRDFHMAWAPAWGC